MSTIIAISHYYKDAKLNTAIGFMSTGGAVAMMIFPPTADFLIRVYGWRGALLILGAINFHLLICCAVIRPHQVHRTTELSPLLPNDAERQTIPVLPNNAESETIHLLPNDAESQTSEEEACFSGHILQHLLIIARVIQDFFKHTCRLFFRTPKFIPVPIYIIFSSACFSGWIVFQVPHLIMKGIPSQQAAFLASIGGIGFITGEFCGSNS
ncbi:monocarboxylate transporter 12-like [Amphiura filiformis]|uniref:monocarboxylate transporter 12-like n=1 Tax=Amphiura filiformis TaxID=82378 RepID=UPI003B20D708